VALIWDQFLKVYWLQGGETCRWRPGSIRVCQSVL
jgi:hypothetical protein